MSNPSRRPGAAPTRHTLGRVPDSFVRRLPPGAGRGRFDAGPGHAGLPWPEASSGDRPAQRSHSTLGAPPGGLRGRVPGVVRAAPLGGGAEVRASDITGRIRRTLRDAQLKLLGAQRKLEASAASLHARLGTRS
jgi:hypothetical protein